MIEDPYRAGVPTDPHPASQILGWRGVIGLGYLHMAIAIHGSLRFLERGESLGRQRPQDRLLHFAKHTTHVLPRGAMNPRVGDGRLPMRKMVILFLKTLELAALESILLNVIDASFYLAFMPWHVRLRGQDHDAVVPAKRRHL